MENLIADVDSRIGLLHVPRGVLRDIRRAFTHTDPRYGRARGAGYSTWGKSSVLKTFTVDGPLVTVPRGGANRLRAIAREHGMVLRLRDGRTTAPVALPAFNGPTLRPYQAAAVQRAVERQQGIIRAPTGSGKSMSALALIAAIGQRSMILVSDRNLLQQWVSVVRSCFGLPEESVGILGLGKRYVPGCPIVLAMVQTLSRKGSARLHEVLARESFGALIVDECQTVAANMFQSVVDQIPAKYRIGFSADETRKDRMEFMIYDIMGSPIFEVDRDDLIRAGVVHAVDARVVPTEFTADWYVNAEVVDRNFVQLVFEMSECDARNALLLNAVDGILDAGETPLMVFTHRRDHVTALVSMLESRGIRAVTLLGGSDKREFADGLARLRSGDVKVAVGTYKAIGTGIDIPVIRAGLCATPISAKNSQFFNQVRGRICRVAEGKQAASIYYLWDTEVFPNQLGALEDWNDKRVTVLRGGRWMTSREWLRAERAER